MHNKKKYIQFCKEESIPIFSQYWWLDSVCGENNWNVLLYESGGQIWASMPYCMKKKFGFKVITMPKLTQVLGPYIKYPMGQKYYKRLSWEKKIMNYFIDKLPKFDYFNMNFHYTIANWLPFYWKGFKQTTRYTYVIDKNMDIETLSKDFETDIRRRRRKKAKKLGISIEESKDVYKLYKLVIQTFEKQNLSVPYSFEFLKGLFEKIYKNSAGKIFFAMWNNKPIAGNLLVFDEKTVYYLVGGIDLENKSIGGMDMVLFESIRFALQSNKNFDFEGSMIEPIEKYFRSFGAMQKPYFQITKINSKILKIRECLREFKR